MNAPHVPGEQAIHIPRPDYMLSICCVQLEGGRFCSRACCVRRSLPWVWWGWASWEADAPNRVERGVPVSSRPRPHNVSILLNAVQEPVHIPQSKSPDDRRLGRLRGVFCGSDGVPEEGVEPPLSCENMTLNHARLPVPPLGQRLVLSRNHTGCCCESLVARKHAPVP